MKFSCDKAILQNAISVTARAVAVKSSIVALSGLLLRCSNGTLTVCGYNLTVGICTEVPVDVEEDGALVLNAGIFGGIVSKMPDDVISVSSNSKQLTKLTCGNAAFEISGMDAADFPELPEVDGAAMIEVAEKDLRSMIQQTSFAVSSDASKPTYTGALFDCAGGTLTVVACDGYRVALRREAIESPVADQSFIVPGAALREAERMCSDGKQVASISVGERHILFTIGNSWIVSRRLDGGFIDYKSVIPKTNPVSVTVSPADLLESIERVSVVTNKVKAPVRVAFESGRAILSANTATGDARDVCRYDGDGGGLEIGFNGRYLLEAMRFAPSEKVVMQLNTPTSPAVIMPADGGESFLYMVLPVRMKARRKENDNA